MLFAPPKAEKAGGAQEAPPEKSVEYSDTEQEKAEQAADPALISALLKFRSMG